MEAYFDASMYNIQPIPPEVPTELWKLLEANRNSFEEKVKTGKSPTTNYSPEEIKQLWQEKTAMDWEIIRHFPLLLAMEPIQYYITKK